MYVYFVQQGNDGPIKIGFTGGVPERLKDLQIANPSVLYLLAVQQSDNGLESELHNRFSAFRIRGEWFLPSRELLKYIENLRETRFLLPCSNNGKPKARSVLEKYLLEKNITQGKAAEELGISRQWVNNLVQGNPASRDLAPKLVKWSNGAISLEEALYPPNNKDAA